MASRQKPAAPSGPAAPAGFGSKATRHAEIETKLEIAADATLPDLSRRRKLAAAGVVGAAEPATYHLDATYYDTRDLDLLRSRMTLRRRTGGPDAGWHLKLPAAAGARTEVGLPLSAGDDGNVPDEFVNLVRGAARGRTLRPVARVVNDRTVRHLLDADGRTLVEIADDHVSATPLREGIAKPSRWREVEVEIVDGTTEQLATTVELLIAAGAEKASSASKLARTLGIATTAPARRTRSAGAAVVAAMGRQRDLLITADRGLREQTEVAPFDARSAARRLRAGLTVYAPLFEGPNASGLRSRLRSVSSALDAARDLEVAERRLLAQLTDEPDDYAGPARARLRDAFGRRSAAARTEIDVLIDSKDYLQLLRDLDDFVVKPPLSRRGHGASAVELPALIGDAWIGLRERADVALADPGNIAAVHRVRKAAKTMRYATEAAVGSLGSDAVVFASALEEIQETLGEFTDAGIAAAFLAEFALEDDTDGVSGFTFGRLHAFEQAMAHGAFDEFSDAWDRVEDGDLVAALGR
ncbi:MAG TPA: CYTH and CHAD domain-containing protein [Mycobacterium sp.]